MKRSNTQRSSSNKSKKASKSKSQPKVKKVSKKKQVEEEKKQQAQQIVALGPVIHKQGEIIGVKNRQNARIFDVVKVHTDARQADQGIQVLRFEMDQIQDQRSRSCILSRDFVGSPNFYLVAFDEIIYGFDVKQKKKKIVLDDPIKIRKSDIKKANKALKATFKQNKAQQKEKVLKEKEDKARLNEDQKREKLIKKEEGNKKRPKVQQIEQIKPQAQQVKPKSRAQRAQIRSNRMDESEGEEGKEQQINTDANNDGPQRKRDVKAKAKAKVKQAVIKKKEPEPLREDVEIPNEIRTKESQEQKLFQECCQSCSNRNCLRAVEVGSEELFDKCIQSKAYITSLIAHMSPEMRFSALERAIALNRHAIIEMLLSQRKPESESRMKQKDAQIAKFDTGEVGKMAFGVKVRKVNIMRGNRQGNNAFLEDSNHIWQTPIEYLLKSDFCMSKIFAEDSVTKETIDVLIQVLGAKLFTDEFIVRALPDILKHGCYQALLAIFEFKGHKENPKDSLFSKVFYQLLTCQTEKEFSAPKAELVTASQNEHYKPAHIAALNPSGAGLLYLKSQGELIDVAFQKVATAHFAAVCSSTKNLQILLDNEIDLHNEDANKKTPLHWAVEARMPASHVKLIIEDLDYQFKKDAKDDHKKMVIHYVGQFGCFKDQTTEVMDLMMENKAKMSMAGGWDKYTPLVYAATYGQEEVVKYFLENVPRLNINKGDKYSRSPLIMACRNGHVRIAALLIKHNADINKPDTSGNTPLHHAAAYGWQECVSLLVKYGADPSPENAWKTTPIVIALQKNHLAIVKELLNDDINANIKDDEGRTLLTLSMANINGETADFISLLLSEKQADPNLQDAKGRTALYHLVHNMTQKKRGLFEDHDELEFKIAKILLSAGANLSLKSKDGKSPFTLAFEHGFSELLKLFGGNVDLNQDPTLFFAISGINILKLKTHNLITECINQKRLEDETINYVNDQGFTPFLFYINEFCTLQSNTLNTIQNMVLRRDAVIDNESITIEFSKNANNGVQPSPAALGIFKSEITEPFIDFLKKLLESGANPNAYILKLKQFREESGILSQTQQNHMSQLSSQVQAAALARRPPEKDQYISEVLGLSNAVHILIQNQNQQDLFDYLMQIKGLELNQVNFQKMTPFFKLVKTKDIKQDPFSKHCFERLLQSGQVDINSPDQFGSTAFWYFYTNKRYEEAMYLVDQGANINHMDNYGEFALKRELYANDYGLMKKLLEKGADPNQKDEFGRTVLHLACNTAHRKDMKEIIQILVKYNADLSCLDFKQRTPIHYMFIRKNRRFEVDYFDPLQQGITLLINKATKAQVNVNQQDVNGKSLIHYAAQRGSLETLEYLVSIFGLENLQFDLLDKWLNTSLSVAINFKHYKFVEKLMNYEVINMKDFIYEEPLKRPGNNQLQNNQMGLFGQQQQAQDNNEQSDFEFMEVQQKNINDGVGGQDSSQSQKKHNKEEALNLFRYIIRNNIGELEKLFIKHNYDKIQMIIDYICEGQINKLFEVIEQHFKAQAGTKESILIQKNEKQQNLIHVLSRNSHRIKEIGEIVKFYKQLSEEGVDPKEIDYKGRSVLQLAVMSGNIHFIKFLIDVELVDIHTTDFRGQNVITTLLKGDRILKANPAILEYLIQKGADPNSLFAESLYDSHQEKENGTYLSKDEEEKGNEINSVLQINKKSGYKTTCVIHAIRHESKDREHIKVILKILLKYSNLSVFDSTGRDAFMYIAMRNHNRTFNFILNALKEQNNLNVVKNNVNLENGKSFVHYIVNPLAFGSYENSEILKKALEFGFEANLKDSKGKTPYEYASQQNSGVLKKVFDQFGIDCLQKKLDKADVEMQIEDLLGQDAKQGKDHVGFEKDAFDYLYSIQMQIDPQNSVPCDASGKFNEDCEVMFDSERTQQHFDVYLTRVEIGKFQPGGDYLFYRMQLVWDRARELCILLTRWGRIGEEGAFQKTPFSKREDGIEEFRKIFEQKTSNKWCPKDKFAKKFRKFQLMRTNYVTIDQKNYLVPFNNQEGAPVLRHTSKEVIEVMREICDVNTYLKALQNSGVDPKAMPFSNLHRQNLYDALEVLQKLEKTLDKLENLNPRPYAENERNTLLSLREKMWYLSGRFYEQIPHMEYRNKMVPPISTTALLATKSQMLQSLIEIEMASKIFLGAQGKKDEINPLEYCLLASGVDMEALQESSSEFKLLEDYVKNTNIDNKEKQILRILRVNKESDNIKFKHEMENRVLLFHGSRISNFLSILSQGLKVQPIQVKRQGDLLGKGIYFSDSVSKALQYTTDQNAPPHSSRFILVCEVALGESKEMMRFQNNYKLEEGFNSVQGVGRQGPEKKKFVTLPDGAKVPYGKSEVYANQRGIAQDFQFNEYVVGDPDQVRFRYLIQMK